VYELLDFLLKKPSLHRQFLAAVILLAGAGPAEHSLHLQQPELYQFHEYFVHLRVANGVRAHRGYPLRLLDNAYEAAQAENLEH